ncbi:diacylglycerol/lipid kinase family protein [Noviherbaspirillum sp.]|uniref:diacylglycerol/lipid kinase family protein n=1 Tax=Noviherbaspirillum sp. TaxID=1926288 RepID=UPI002FE2AA11
MSVIPDVSDAPLLIVMNAGSGRKDRTETRETITRVLTEAGREHRLILVENPKQIVEIARRTVQEAKACGGVVVVGGGDGTINAVANAVLGSGCAFGVLPLGTFNYFARTHNIPEDTEEATRLLLTARPHPVQVGLVNQHLFLVNASLGLYPKLLEDREAYKRQYGRSRFVAMLSGVVTILRQHRQLRLTLERHGQVTQMRTPTVFVGNNRLQMEQTGIPLAEALEEGQLAAVVLKPVGTLAMLWLLVRGALGQLGDADHVISFGVRRLTVRPSRLYRIRRVKVATDGEIGWLDAPLEFRVGPEPLYLLKPDPPADDNNEAAS